MITLTQLFNLANVFVLPFWFLMIVLPKWEITKKVMASTLMFIPLIVLYIYLLGGTIDAESAKALSNPQLADLARLFGNEQATATGWIHFLVMDLFVGRWIYTEGQAKGIITTHSLILCLFAGPIGLLSHLLTAGIKSKFFAATEQLATDN